MSAPDAPALLPDEHVIWTGGPAPLPYRPRFDWLGLWCGVMAVVLLAVGLFMGDVVPILGVMLFAGVAIARVFPAPLGRRAQPPVYVLTDRRVILHEPALDRTRSYGLDRISPHLDVTTQGGTLWLAEEPAGPRLGSRLAERPLRLGFVDVASPGHVMDLVEEARAAFGR